MTRPIYQAGVYSVGEIIGDWIGMCLRWHAKEIFFAADEPTNSVRHAFPPPIISNQGLQPNHATVSTHSFHCRLFYSMGLGDVPSTLEATFTAPGNEPNGVQYKKLERRGARGARGAGRRARDLNNKGSHHILRK